MINKSLYWKIALAFVLVAFITAAMVAVFVRVTSVDRLTQLVFDQQRDSLTTILANYYQTNGSWDGLVNNWPQLQRDNAVSGMGMGPGNMGQGAGEHMAAGRILYGLADADGTVIIPVGQFQKIGQQLTTRQIRSGTSIEVNGKPVGVLLTTNALPVYNVAETLFLQRTNRALLLAMLGAMLAALLIGLFLARTLTRPLQALTQAAQKITNGQLDQQVDVKSDDEIGELGLAFNQMSREVARVNQQRRQMTADIAHDLRTPLTVISGYVESMRDGVLQPTQQRLELIYSEIGRLQHLVTDLRMLSQADAGELRLEPQTVDPLAILQHTAEIHRHQASQQEVSLQVQAETGLPGIRADEARFMQMMDNLISNALRYTPAGGSITLSAQRQANGIEFSVSDTGSGIEAADLPWIFDRFQRGDKSRHSDGNESGLGLAIVKALAEAHGGKVSAESVVGQGATITVWLPV